MKTLISVFALFISFGTFLSAQISEEDRVMVKGRQNAIIIDLPNTTSRFVQTEWKDFIKKYGKVKRVKKSKEDVVSGAQLLGIGGVNPVDLYSRTEEAGSASRMMIWVDLGGSLVSSDNNPNAFKGCKDLLEDFAHKVEIDLVQIELDDQLKALNKLENKMQKLRKDNDGYHKDIETAREKIMKAEANIEKNIQDQELAQQEIIAQQGIVESVRDSLNTVRLRRND
jgi:hypothetical protein